MKGKGKTVLMVVLAAMAKLAVMAEVGFRVSNVAPLDDVITTYDGSSTMTMSVRNGATLPDPENKDRTLGQTFTLETRAVVNRVTVRMGRDGLIPGVSGSHILWLAIMSDTNGDGSVDTLRGGIADYDLSGFTMGKEQYLTFEFDAVELDAGLHSFELGWREDGSDTHDNNNQNLVLLRTTQGTYAGGGQISQSGYTRFPNTLSGHSSNDLFFYVQTVPGGASLSLGLISPSE